MSRSYRILPHLWYSRETTDDDPVVEAQSATQYAHQSPTSARGIGASLWDNPRSELLMRRCTAFMDRPIILLARQIHTGLELGNRNMDPSRMRGRAMLRVKMRAKKRAEVRTEARAMRELEVDLFSMLFIKRTELKDMEWWHGVIWRMVQGIRTPLLANLIIYE